MSKFYESCEGRLINLDHVACIVAGPKDEKKSSELQRWRCQDVEGDTIAHVYAYEVDSLRLSQCPVVPNTKEDARLVMFSFYGEEEDSKPSLHVEKHQIVAWRIEDSDRALPISATATTRNKPDNVIWCLEVPDERSEGADDSRWVFIDDEVEFDDDRAAWEYAERELRAKWEEEERSESTT